MTDIRQEVGLPTAIPETPQELAQAVLDIIRFHPEKHQQTWWATGAEDSRQEPTVQLDCRTTACVAGWTIYASGQRVSNSRGSLNPQEGVVYSPQVGDVAQDLLGLSTEERYVLFAALRTREQVIQALEYLAKGDPIPEDALMYTAPAEKCNCCN